MGEYNAFHETQRQQIAGTEAKEAAKFLQNDSKEGDRKLWAEIVDLYSKHNKPEDSSPEKFDGVKTASDAMYKLKDMSHGKISGEDKNQNGVLEINEIFVKDHNDNWTYFAPKEKQESKPWYGSWGAKDTGAQNPLEGAVRNWKTQEELIENPHKK
jgi:hypothetical protein